MTNPSTDKAAERLEAILRACAEDAKRPVPRPEFGRNVAQSPAPGIISLANGLIAIADAIRDDLLSKDLGHD